MKLMLFFKMRKILSRFQKLKKKYESIFLILEIMAFQPVPVIFLNYDGNASDRESMCYQTAQRFQI